MANDPVKAQAQTVEALEQSAQSLKRNIATSRKALQAVRQAQAVLLGIQVTVHTQSPEGSHSDTSNSENRA
jgi:hypothetical protein